MQVALRLASKVRVRPEGKLGPCCDGWNLHFFQPEFKAPSPPPRLDLSLLRSHC